MDFNTYIASQPRGTLTKLAAALGVTKGRLAQLRDGSDWSPELALKAEQVTGGMMDAAMLSPVVAQARHPLQAIEAERGQ